MNKDIARRWVNLLRSGKHPQGQGALQKDGKFCCLGVLCEMAVEDGVIPPPDMGSREAAYGHDDELKDPDLPPTSVLVWSGLDVYRVYDVEGLDIHETLYGLNDDRYFTFEQIANVIEETHLR